MIQILKLPDEFSIVILMNILCLELNFRLKTQADFQSASAFSPEMNFRAIPRNTEE